MASSMNRIIMREFLIGTKTVRMYAQKNGKISIQIFDETQKKICQRYYPSVEMANAFIHVYRKNVP